MNIDRCRVVARFCRRFRRRMKVRIGGLITADKFYRIDARLTGNGESLSLCLSALERSKHDDGGDNEPNSPEHKYPPLIRWRRGVRHAHKDLYAFSVC